MAYRRSSSRRSSVRSRGRNGGGRSRCLYRSASGRPARRPRSGRTRSAGRTQHTVRIVMEQAPAQGAALLQPGQMVDNSTPAKRRF